MSALPIRSGLKHPLMAAVVATPLMTLPVLVLGQDRPATASEDGIALAIVYDTSGSMQEKVSDGAGGTAPKYQIANRALGGIVDRLQAFVAAAPRETPRKMQAGLVVFHDASARFAVSFGAFNADALRQWLKRFAAPSGTTPLGEAVRVAGESALASKLSRKHVLVLTDGINTSGPDPAAVIPRLREQAERGQTAVSFHFVAFDVKAKVFDPVTKLGATVVEAADAKQLNEQLDFILQQKILLEEEEPPKTK